jgi:serine/threonine protein kinase/WD40 repeat protein
MPTPSVGAFSDSLRERHLLDPAQLEEVRATLADAFPDAAALARELVRRGWLTHYQANQLFQNGGTGLVLGSYVLLEPLGTGGMGQVFKARNWKFGQIVALKLVRPDRSTREAALRRFRREIQAASQLQHPNVVRALDADECNGTCLLAMEYVDGIDLGRLVGQRGPLPVAEACQYIRQAALGLQHAYERGLVHRDIKPHNLLLARDGTIKILDLGLARILSGGDASVSLTESGAVLGTPDYIAPEQARDSRNADTRSDLYSLGCTLYFLLTGKAVFGGASMTEKLVRHQIDPPPDVCDLRSDAPAGLSQLIRKLLAKRPQDRCQKPAELVAVLETLLISGRLPQGYVTEAAPPPEAVPVADTASVNTWAGLASESTAEDRPKLPRRRRTGTRRLWLQVAAALGVLLLLMGLLLFVVLRFGNWSLSEPEPVPSGSPTVAVDATGGWHDTGVDVIEDEEFRVTTVGQWRKRGKASGPGGLLEEPRDRAILPTAPLMALLARVDNDPHPFAVTPEVMHAPRAGRLYLRANDLDATGATGRLQATVSGGARSSQPAPAPGPCLAEAAEAAWRELRPRAEDPKADAAALAPELLAFRQRFAGAPQVGLVNALLPGVRARLGSPLDRLRAQDIAPEQRQAAGFTADPSALERLVAIWGDSRLRHWDAINATLLSPDGKIIATCCYAERSIILWNAVKGHELRRLRPNCGPQPNPCAFFPDATKLAIAGSGAEVEIWDVQTAKLVHRLNVKQGAVNWIDVSSDGKHVATAGGDGTIKLWDADLADEPQVLMGHTKPVAGVLFGKGDTVLVSASEDGTARIWNVNGQSVQRFTGHPGPVTQVALAPDGKTLAAASAGFLRVWDVEHQSFRDLGNGCAGRMTFLDGGKTLAVNYNNGVQFWDVATGKLVRTLDGRGITATHVSFSGDGRMLVVGVGTMVRILDMTKPNADEVPLLPPREAGLEAVVITDDGRLLATADDLHAVLLRDLATGKVLQQWDDYLASFPYPLGLTFGDAGRLLFSRSTDAGGSVKARAVATGQVIQTYSAGPNCFVLTLSPDEKLLACGSAGSKVELLDRASGKLVRSLGNAAGGAVVSLAFSPDGRVLAVGSTGVPGPQFYETATGRDVRDMLYAGLGKTNHQHAAFSPDGRYLAVSTPGAVGKLLSAQTGKEIRTLPAGGPVVFRPDGKVLAIPGPGTIDLYDVAAGRVTETLRLGPPGAVLTPTFSADGRYLLTINSNGTVYALRL